jgi:hypothetical protein
MGRVLRNDDLDAQHIVPLRRAAAEGCQADPLKEEVPTVSRALVLALFIDPKLDISKVR